MEENEYICSICECEGDEDTGHICSDCLEKYNNGEMGS